MDYAVQSLKMRAKTGDISAMVELGKKYFSGEGVKQSASKAEKYFKKAAKSNSVEGLIELGKVYKEVNPLGNLELCEKVWTKAASLGSDEARCLIASLYYENGYAVRDRDKAIAWLEKPAKKGYVPAQLTLGYIYYNTFEGEEQLKCLDWFKKAAEQDNAEAQYVYGMLFNNLDTGKSVIEGLKEGEKWLLKAAKNGYADAYEELGNMYAYVNDESFINSEKAIECFKKAELDTATTSLGAYYIDNGEIEKGIEQYEKAAGNGYITAMSLLGDLYYEGECIERDFDKAFSWYSRAFTKYSESTYFGLGRCYLYGAGVERDLKKALKYLKKCARYVDEAKYELGNCYFNGWGVPQNKEQAKKLWESAAAEENEHAQKALEQNFKRIVYD